MAAIEHCVNHPDVETRLACSSCGVPICPRCMYQAAVGQKCPDCARVPRSARALGKPAHYARAVGGGMAVALGGGLAMAELLRVVGFGVIILGALLGMLVGRAVSWGASRQAQQPFPGIAAGLAVAGVAVAFMSTGIGLVPGNIFLLLAYGAAGWVANRTVTG